MSKPLIIGVYAEREDGQDYDFNKMFSDLKKAEAYLLQENKVTRDPEKGYVIELTAGQLFASMKYKIPVSENTVPID